MKKKRIKLTDNPCFIGLDMSINGTGICIFNNVQNMVHVEVVEPKLLASSDVAKCVIGRLRISDFSRYREVVNRIIQLIKAFQVKAVVIENYAFGIRKSKSLTKLGELGGILRNALIDMSIPFTEVTPNSAKKFISGKGVCPEPLMLLKVAKKWKEEFDSVKDRRKIDAAIAYGLGRIAWNIYSEKSKMSDLLEYEVEVLKKIAKDKDAKDN